MNRFFESSAIALTLAVAVCFLVSPSSAAPNPAHRGELTLSPKQKAEILLSRKQYDEATEAYKTLLRENPADSALFRGLVKAHAGANRLGTAEDFIREFLSRHTGSSAGQYGLGYLYYLKGDDSKAQEHLRQAILFDERNALAWNNLGASLSRTKSYTFAVEKVKEAIRLEPANPMFYSNLKLIYGAMGETGLFFAEYKQYVRDGKKLVARGYGKVIAKTLRQEAFKAYSLGNLDKSIEKFSEIAAVYRDIRHKPGLAAAYFGLGVLYEEKGDEELAQKYFKKVLSINPGHLQAREKVK